jgi:signal transduction histidine kinase
MSPVPTWRADDPWSIFSLSELAQGGVDAYLQMVAEQAASHFRASGASIFVGSGQVFRVRARAGRQSTVPSTATIVRGEGVAGRVVAAGVARVLGRLSSEPGFLDLAAGDRAAVSSSMVLPLHGPEGEVSGVLNLSRHEGLEPFSEADLDQAKAVAAMVGLSVANANLVESLRSQTQEAERLRRLAEIGQMTAAVAHEIRNPLTGIRSAAQMVRENPEFAEEFLGLIEEEVLKLNALCEEFLAFAKPMELVRQEVRLAELVEAVCERHRPDFERDGVALVFAAAPDLPTMNLDHRRVEQVVHNLLRNARQACHEGCRVEVQVVGDGLTVADDGQGMTPAQIERLFSPFFTTKADGTGLGLSNVRRIVEAHGGSVAAASEPGKGSRFTVVFPRSEN